MAYKFNPLTGNLDEYGPILTGTGTVSAAADGTTALPGIAFANELSTGVSRPGAGQLALSTNGTQRLLIEGDGTISANAGTGTANVVRLYGTSTGTSADAQTSRGITLFLHQTSNTNNNTSAIVFANALTNSGAYIAGQYTSHTNRQTALVFGTGDNAAPTERLRITSAGLVGIGTSAPVELLHVSGGNIRFGSTGFIGEDIAVNPAPIRFGANPGSTYAVARDLEFYANPANNPSSVRMVIKGQTGDVGIGTSAPDVDFHVSNADTARIRLENRDTTGSVAQSVGVIEFEGNDGGTGAAGVRANINAVYEGVDGATALAFGTAADGVSVSEKVRIDRNGRVGIGTTSPSSLLTLRSDSASAVTAIRLENLNASGGVTTQSVGISAVFDYNNGGSVAGAGSITFGKEGTYTTSTAEVDSYLGFATTLNNSTTEKCRITSDGKLLVGTTSARTNLRAGVYGSVGQIETAGTNAFAFIQNAASEQPYRIVLAKQRSGSAGGNTIVNSGDNVGSVEFLANDGTNFIQAAKIETFVDGTPGADDMPGRLVFSTTADGAASPTERMRIKANGTINFSNVAVYADNAAATTGGLAVGDVYRTSTGQLMIRY